MWAGLGMALTGVLAIGLVLSLDDGPGTPGTDSHGRQITGVRTVLVSTGSAPVSQPGGPLHARLLSGRLGAAPMMATVLTDENCAPDAHGVSHCTNRLRMDDGSTMTLMHPHRMSEVPCLAPGERVSVRSA